MQFQHISAIIFTSSSHTEYVNREIIVIATVKNKKILLLLFDVHVFYVLELETSKKMPFVHLSVCLYVSMYVCTYVCLCTPFGCTINFEGVSASTQNLVAVLYV